MNKIVKHSARDLTYRLSGPGYLPPDEDDLALREARQDHRRKFRPLRSGEIEQLTQNGNIATDWGDILVSERFNPKLVKNCRFFGLVRLGDVENLVLEFDGLKLSTGIYDSTLVSCDIGNNVAIHRAAYLAHTLVGDEVIIHNLGRMLTTPFARFGNGILKEGQGEDQRPRLEVCNEAGDRHILAFEGILPADAWLWAKYRAEKELMVRLKELTDLQFDRRPGQYSVVGDRTVIRDCLSIVDAAIGSDAYLEGVDRLESVTIRSNEAEGTRIGEGTSLVDGIVGYGCHVSLGSKALHFVLGTRASLHLGARLIHTFLGDNSTVSCCEILNSLIFPNHEQHHNNSFLIAAAIQGQSNIAAGATIGSNHNSRAVDGELVAGRGFWPGLCTNFKHPCRFASFVLAAKGDYPYELDIPLPFSLIASNTREDTLQVIPAYWFLYNMYALARNSWKFRARDKRVHQEQNLEFEALAPDTVEEMLHALGLLETWTARAWLRVEGKAADETPPEALQAMGRDLLTNQAHTVETLEILAEGLENSARKVRILKTGRAYEIYREMIHFYAVQTLLQFMEERGIEDVTALADPLQGERERRWINLGGQIIAESDLKRLKERIVRRELDSWTAIHAEYDALWERYPLTKAYHAFATLLAINGVGMEDLTGACWAGFLQRAVQTQDKIARLTYESRAKDYETPLRRVTYDSPEEMEAVVGTIEDNSFIQQERDEAELFRQAVARIMESSHLTTPGAVG